MGAHRDGGGIRFGAWLAPHAMKHADAKGFVLIHRYRERVPSDALNPGMSGDSGHPGAVHGFRCITGFALS